jgi:Chitin synthase export chaperone
MLFLYVLTLLLQIITTGSFLTQGSTALVVFTGIHAGLVAALFWALLGTAVVATQIVDDGTMSALIVCVNRLSHWVIARHVCIIDRTCSRSTSSQSRSSL